MANCFLLFMKIRNGNSAQITNVWIRQVEEVEVQLVKIFSYHNTNSKNNNNNMICLYKPVNTGLNLLSFDIKKHFCEWIRITAHVPVSTLYASDSASWLCIDHRVANCCKLSSIQRRKSNIDGS